MIGLRRLANMLNIRKRDGSLQEFNLEKVSKAIEKAFMADHKFYNDDIINMLSLRVPRIEVRQRPSGIV